MKVSAEHKAALVNHENRDEILAILASNPDYSSERSTGRILGQQKDNHGETEGVPEGEIYDVFKLAHWREGFDVDLFLAHEAKHKGKRSTHDLDFCYRPNRKGSYAKLTPGVRKKVLAAYQEQIGATR